MKVAIVIHDINRRGGQERSTLEIVEGLSRKFDCHVFASSADGLPQNVKFHRVPVLLRRPLFVKDFVFRIFASIQVYFGNFDLVHATGASVFKADIFTMQFLHKRWNAERKRLPSLSFMRHLKEFVQVTIDRISEAVVIKLNRTATYVAISDQVRRDLTELYGLLNIISIRHGVNLDEFTPALTNVDSTRDQLGLPKNKKLLLFVGAFERKGLFFLLKALKAPFQNYQDWDLVVVGQGPIERARHECRNLGIENRVHFLGSRNDVARVYSASDLFILPSLYDPFGLVAIEALASGCPIIVSKDSGSFDLIKEGTNGFGLKDATNLNELETVLKKSFSSPDLSSMRVAARQSVAGERWSAKIDQYVSAYEQLL